MGRRKRPKADPTEDWEALLPLFEWPEQQAYEELRPVTLFGAPVAERARETGVPERTMYRMVERFERDGMLSLFATDPAAARARRRGLEPAIRRMIVELKAEHPKLNANEIANIVYVRTGRRLGKHTPGRVLADEVVPLKLSRLFEPYHETEDVRADLVKILTAYRRNDGGRKIRSPRLESCAGIGRRTLDRAVRSAGLAPHRCRAIYDEVWTDDPAALDDTIEEAFELLEKILGDDFDLAVDLDRALKSYALDETISKALHTRAAKSADPAAATEGSGEPAA